MTPAGRVPGDLAGWGIESSVMRRWALVGERLGVGKDEEDEGFTEISSQITC